MVRRFLSRLCAPLLALCALTGLPSGPALAVVHDPDILAARLSYKIVGLLGLGLMALVCLFTPAFAQDVAGTAPMASGPMLGFAIDAVYSIFGPVVAAFVIGVLAKLYSLIGLQQTAANRATVEQVLEMAVRYARMRLGLGGSFAPIPTQHVAEVLDIAAQQAFERAPKALGKFGVADPNSESLRRMLLSRLDGGGALLSEETRVATAP